MIQNIIKKSLVLNQNYLLSGGTSDARFIKNIAPCLEFGLVGKTMHKIDESVSVSDLKKLTKIYEDILVDILLKISKLIVIFSFDLNLRKS